MRYPREPALGCPSTFHCDKGAHLSLLTSSTVQLDSDKRGKSVLVAFDRLIDICLVPVEARKAVSPEGFPSQKKEKGGGFHLMLTLCFAAWGGEGHYSLFIRRKGEAWGGDLARLRLSHGTKWRSWVLNPDSTMCQRNSEHSKEHM